MVKRILRWTVALLLSVAVIGCLFAIYAAASPVPKREFDDTWYHTDPHVTFEGGTKFAAQHRWAVFRAQLDHFVHPIGPGGRVIAPAAASAPNQSGDVFLYFGYRDAPGDTGLHYFPVYCYSERQSRLVWKALQDNSP